MQLMESSTSSRVKVLLISSLWAFWFYLCVVAASAYKGSPGIYIVFSVAFIALLISGFRGQRTYSYTYLVLLLWLGFWLKISCNLAYHVQFPEPIGQFTGSSADWDHVLLIAIVAAMGTMFSRFVFSYLPGNMQSVLGGNKTIPRWLKDYNKLHLALFVLVLVITSIANNYFGIFVLGLDVKTRLIWPFNALITLMLVGAGFTMWASSILWWRLLAGRPLFKTLVILEISGAIITVSTLSRGQVVFFSLTLLHALYLNRERVADWTVKKYIFLLFAFCVIVISSFFFVNQMRDHLHFDKAPAPATESKSISINSASSKLNSFLDFSVKRWIGAEGVMAVSSYPGLGMDLIFQASAEKPGQGHRNIYQTIAPWPKPSQNSIRLKKNVNSVSLPGGIGFLYYSSSLVFVFVTVILISVLLQYSESVIFLATGNPFLCAGVAWFASISFIHFGGTPLYLIPALVFLALSICFVATIQSSRLSRFLGLSMQK